MRLNMTERVFAVNMHQSGNYRGKAAMLLVMWI